MEQGANISDGRSGLSLRMESGGDDVNEMVDEADPLDRGGNDGHFSGHAAHHGSSRDQNFSDIAFWGN